MFARVKKSGNYQYLHCSAEVRPSIELIIVVIFCSGCNDSSFAIITIQGMHDTRQPDIRTKNDCVIFCFYNLLFFPFVYSAPIFEIHHGLESSSALVCDGVFLVYANGSLCSL